MKYTFRNLVGHHIWACEESQVEEYMMGFAEGITEDDKTQHAIQFCFKNMGPPPLEVITKVSVCELPDQKVEEHWSLGPFDILVEIAQNAEVAYG